MESKQRYKVIGLMSGTSLDGLDIAACTIEHAAKGWSFKIHHAETIRYAASWVKKLAGAHLLPSGNLIETDIRYGKLIGSAVVKFMNEKKFRPDFISSHGHTIFHQPSKGFTYQMGNGNAIHAVTGLPVVCDFRSMDVLRGGEGAPLVPAGDKFLFSGYDICLNLGGIANLSMEVHRERIAFDVCFTNMALNYLALKAGKKFDPNGQMAGAGDVNRILLRKLNTLYKKFRHNRPSLGREIFEEKIRPLLDDDAVPLRDRLATLTESAAHEIARAIPANRKIRKVLCTGGGAFNSFLISRILELGGDRLTLILPDEDIIKFKEAVVFAFLGVLRVRDEVNCLKSVTGATRDSSAGVLVGF